MKRTVLFPGRGPEWHALRNQNITSTACAAIFGVSPYLTKYELWHRLHDNIMVEQLVGERLSWGNRLEAAIAHGAAEDNDWRVREFREFIILDGLRIASSFDFVTIGEDGNDEFNLEIKNVDGLQFKNGWMLDEDGHLEAPAHIELQVQHQMLVSGLNVSYIAALVGGNEIKLLKRERDDEICQRILDECAKFWESIDNNEPPEPDFEKDAAFISSLYQFANPGTVMDAHGDERMKHLVMSYYEAGQLAKSAEEHKQAARAEMLMAIGDFEKVVGDGYSISAGMVGPTVIESFERKGFRNFRVYLKKKKE